MLAMVIEKPTQVTMVIAVPRSSGWAFLATSAENCGESVITVTPQKIIKSMNNHGGSSHKNGDNKQQAAEPARAYNATWALPTLTDHRPPAKQPIAPDPIIKKLV